MPEAVPEGVVVGGWSYAIAAYSLTALGLIIWAWSITSRLKRALREEKEP